jgi:hypothetical protein
VRIEVSSVSTGIKANLSPLQGKLDIHNFSNPTPPPVYALAYGFSFYNMLAFPIYLLRFLVLTEKK